MKRTVKKTGMQSIGVFLVIALSVGCTVDLDGEEGNFSFRYLDSEGSVAQDLAVGAKVNVEVRDANSDEVVDLEEVFSDEGDVVDIVDVQQQRFTMEALSAGNARITAEAIMRDGEELSDTVSIRSAEVAGVELDSLCSEDLFLTDSRARFSYRMDDASGSRLTGYGYYPVSVEPSEGGEVEEDFEVLRAMQITTGSEAGTFEVVSDLGSDSQSFELIDPADIDEIELTGQLTSIEEGEEKSVAMLGLESFGRTVCGPLGASVELTSETPDKCAVQHGQIVESVDLLTLNAVIVEGLEVGDCEITVAIPDAGLEHTIEIDVL